MRIVLWPLNYLPIVGGSEVQIHFLARALKELGHAVLVIANHPYLSVGAVQNQPFEGIEVIRFPFAQTLVDFNLAQIKHILLQVTALLQSFKPDLIHVHALTCAMSFYQVRIGQTTKIPMCLTIHGGLLEKEQQTKTECVSLCKMVKAISTPSQDSLKMFDLHHPSVHVIYNGLPELSTPLQPLPLAPTLVMIGRLVEEKGFSLAFYAVKQLVAKYPNLKLIVVGDGELRQELEDLRVVLNLERVIEMVGALPNAKVHHWIDQARLVLIPSLHESFCLVALEAALRARPVIASRIPGLQEVVKHTTSGLLIHPNDVMALVEAIDSLLQNPSQVERISQTAYTSALERFSLQKTVQGYLNMYQHVLGEINAFASC